MTQKKLIHIDEAAPGTLKCDAVGCAYEDAAPSAVTEDMIGRPCPKCGANLLTREDFEETQRIIASIGVVNRAFGHLGAESSGPDHTTVRIGVHGGNFSISLTPHGDRS